MHIPRHPWVYPESPNILSLVDDIMNARFPEILISGPRNCGKSFLVSQCELSLAEMYPGIQILNLRSEMTAMGALLNQWDNYLLKYGLDDKRNPFTFHSSTKKEPRTHIQFENGSTILFAGMDVPNKALGTAIDFAFYNEIQLEKKQEHWSAILGAMEGGRAGNWGNGKHLAIADMNPTGKKFWAYLRANPIDVDETPAMKHYRVRHRDHPHFYVWSRQKWTNKGRGTVDGLDRAYIVGTFDHRRNVLGQFCSAEGACFTQFNEKRHVIPIHPNDFSVEKQWRISVDFGNTTASGLYFTMPDRSTRLFKEYYKLDPSPTRLVEYFEYWHKTYGVPKNEIHKTITDIETGNRAILKESGYYPQVANKAVPITEGIQIVEKAFKNDEFFINSECLDHPEPLLENKIQCLADELPEIHYPPESERTGFKGHDDKPDKSCVRHAADHTRYCLVDIRKGIELPDMFSVF